MNNKRKAQERTTRRVLNDIGYNRNYHRVHSKDEQDDTYRNGELIVAANILTDLAARRERQRNLIEQAEVYTEIRAGTYDYRHANPYDAGYPAIPETPPPEWPLTRDEWPYLVDTQSELITKAASLMVAETERLSRLSNSTRRNPYSTLDPEYVELQNKRHEIGETQRRNSWRNRAKTKIEVDIATPAAYAGTSSPATSNSIGFSNIQEQYAYDSGQETCEPESQFQ